MAMVRSEFLNCPNPKPSSPNSYLIPVGDVLDELLAVVLGHGGELRRDLLLHQLRPPLTAEVQRLLFEQVHHALKREPIGQ